MSLRWDNLVVHAPRTSLARLRRRDNDSQGKRLLDGVTGEACPGEMIAVMGPSGAGKTTLLNALSRRMPITDGQLYLDNEPVSSRKVQEASSYVPQENALLGTLTVYETLYYSAKLSLPSGTKSAVVHDRAEQVLTALGLAHVRNQQIGTPISRGISGGQMRRVSAGCSLVSLPRILYLDEITSGLDSTTAYEVMIKIRRFVREHHIICVATIHSPSTSLFHVFDKVCLLAGGKTVFLGPCDGVIPYFTALGYPSPLYTNPADFALELVNVDFEPDQEDKTGDEETLIAHPRERLLKLQQAWSAKDLNSVRRSDIGASSTGTIVELGTEKPLDSPTSPMKGDDEKPILPVLLNAGARFQPAVGGSSTIRQTAILIERNWLNYKRSLLAYGIRLFMYIGIGAVIALVYMRPALTDSRIQDRLSVHFGPIAFFAFMSVAGVPAFLEDRLVMKKEQDNGLYGPAAFTLANTAIILPFLFVCSFASSLILYFGVGIGSEARPFFTWFLFVWLGVLVAEAMVLFIAAAIPIFIASLAISAFVNAFFMVIQGFFIKAIHLPRFWYWIHWADFQTLTYNAIVKLDLKNVVFQCQGSVAENTCMCSYPPTQWLLEQGQCAVAGTDILNNLGIGGTRPGVYGAALVGIFVFWRVLFYGVLKLQQQSW